MTTNMRDFTKQLRKEIDATRAQRNMRISSSEGWVALNARLNALCDVLKVLQGGQFYYLTENERIGL